MYLLGSLFLWNTDHKNLIQILKQEDLPPSIFRLVMKLLYFSFLISHIAGSYLPISDQISRLRIHIVKMFEPFLLNNKRYKNFNEYQQELQQKVIESKKQ